MAWDGHGGGDGRGNLRAAKTPPLQSAFAGMPLRIALRSRCRHCRRRHARTIPHMEIHGFIIGAALVRAGTRYARHRPYRECDSQLAN